jgi:site-specific DNA-cytosine methylase
VQDTATIPTPGIHSSRDAVFSFFSGAGFLDLGFEKSGFEIAFANEINAEFVEGYRHSRRKMGLPLPRYGIACDSIDDHLEPEGAAALKKQIGETRRNGGQSSIANSSIRSSRTSMRRDNKD